MRRKTCFDELCMEPLLAQRKKGFSIKPEAPAKFSCYRAVWSVQDSYLGEVCISFPSMGTGQGMLAHHQRTLTSALLSASTATRSKNPVKSGPSSDSELTPSDLKDLSSHIPVSWHQHRYEITKGKVAAITVFFFSCWNSNLGAKISNPAFTKEGISTPSQQLTQDLRARVDLRMG